MRFITIECTCALRPEYADGAKPSFYVDEKKAAYMFLKLRDKAASGQARVQKELIILQNGDTVQGLPPLPNLRDYNLYFGVHLHGLHVLSIKDD
jgi:hypothetical protein